MGDYDCGHRIGDIAGHRGCRLIRRFIQIVLIAWALGFCAYMLLIGKPLDGRKTAIREKARETKGEAVDMMKTYLEGEEEALDGFEFLSMAEAGELCHWEIVQVIAFTTDDAEVKTLADFVQWCRANPKTATYATTAAGGTPHFSGLMLSQESKVDMTPVHYKGGAPALQDLIGGHVSSSVKPVGEALPFAKAGTIRVLGVTSPKRSVFLPDVPSMKEAGYDVVIEAWLGALVPSKVPAEIVGKLNGAIGTICSAPSVKEKLAQLGNEPASMTPAQFAATVKADIDRWGPVVKASGFVAD